MNLLSYSATHKDDKIPHLLLTNQPGLITNVSVTPSLICFSGDHHSIKFRIKNVNGKKLKDVKFLTISKLIGAEWPVKYDLMTV